jgi:hypothetical protein
LGWGATAVERTTAEPAAPASDSKGSSDEVDGRRSVGGEASRAWSFDEKSRGGCGTRPPKHGEEEGRRREEGTEPKAMAADEVSCGGDAWSPARSREPSILASSQNSLTMGAILPRRRITCNSLGRTKYLMPSLLWKP